MRTRAWGAAGLLGFAILTGSAGLAAAGGDGEAPTVEGGDGSTHFWTADAYVVEATGCADFADNPNVAVGTDHTSTFNADFVLEDGVLTTASGGEGVLREDGSYHLEFEAVGPAAIRTIDGRIGPPRDDYSAEVDGTVVTPYPNGTSSCLLTWEITEGYINLDQTGFGVDLELTPLDEPGSGGGSTDDQDDSGGVPGWVWPLGAVLLGVLGGLVVWWWRHQQEAARSPECAQARADAKAAQARAETARSEAQAAATAHDRAKAAREEAVKAFRAAVLHQESYAEDAATHWSTDAVRLKREAQQALDAARKAGTMTEAEYRTSLSQLDSEDAHRDFEAKGKAQRDAEVDRRLKERKEAEAREQEAANRLLDADAAADQAAADAAAADRRAASICSGTAPAPAPSGPSDGLSKTPKDDPAPIGPTTPLGATPDEEHLGPTTPLGATPDPPTKPSGK